MPCRLCDERGKTWSGSDPKCAFENDTFNNDNWNCATMNKLREITYELKTNTRDDMSCGSIGYVPMSNDFAPEDFDTFGGYIVMMWYKERGRIGSAVFMTDDCTTDLTIQHAELAINTYENNYK